MVKNAGGGSDIIGTEQTRCAAPEGHRLASTHIGAVEINPALFKSLQYDPARDFDPVSLVLTGPMIWSGTSCGQGLGIRAVTW